MSTLPQQDVLRRGLALPSTRYPGGYFATRSPIDTAWSDLMIAVLTPKGSRAMARDFGSALLDVLFEADPASQQAMVEVIVREAAEAFCPHVVVYEVEVSGEGGEGAVSLQITFGLVNDVGRVTRLVELDRSRVVENLSNQ